MSGWRSRTAASVSEFVAPANACRPVRSSYRQAAERPDIRALVDRQPPRLFGTHVGGRSDHDAGTGRQWGRARRQWALGETLCHAEIQNLDLSVRGQRDVARLQIAMNDSLFVCSVESVGDLPRDGERPRQCDACVVCRAGQLRQRRSVDQLHHERRRASGLVEPVHLGDVPMVQRREHLRFTLEAGQPLRIRSKCCR